MTIGEAIPAWHQFFLATASAAAVLLGLTFVGMSIHYDTRHLDRRLVALALDSAVPLFYALLTCLVMLVPIAQPWVPSGALVVVGALATMNAGAPLFGPWFADATRPRPDHRFFDRLRYLLPLLAALALVPTALALLVAPEPALYGVAFIVLALVAFGMQNAWDLLLRRDLRGRINVPPGEDDGT
jgi:cell division protein FtsW (lipid II flippase)